RIKNEHDFKEPEVRTFDPDAPLPGQKKESPAQVLVEKTPIDTLKEDSPADLADATQEHSREHGSHQDALDQKLPEQTFEQPENINTEEHEIEQALNTLNTQIAEQDSSSTSADETPEKQVKANPFANLSLDPTWDPNTKEKPTIEPKKAVPKSAELIAAEERAKQLKTDE
ncbi:MAG: cell surface protein, partial [Pseudoalteromonas sp.]